jgi:flavorubredoxin
LVDTVKKPFLHEMLSRVASVIDPEKIDIIVSNHSEMDHSGCLFETMDIVHPTKVFASKTGVKTLSRHFHRPDEITPVATGDVIDLGNMKLSAIETRMLHWPDSMFTYLPEERLLFSQDGFGMHLASTERFDDELPEDLLTYESAKYFANILLPFSGILEKVLKDFLALKLDIKIIAPDHGPIWRGNIGKPIELYTQWAAQKPTGKVVIVYDTMWGSTGTMAQAVAEGAASAGARAKVMPLSGSHRSDVATEILDAGGLIVGSPTINNGLFPSLADVLTYLTGLKRKNLVGAAFGSYGWSGESIKQIEEYLDRMSVEKVAESVRVQYVPTEADLAECYKLGRTVGEKVVENCAK